MTATAKRCINCNRDVSSDKRMKDTSGKYWCMKCGEADRAKKGQAAKPGVACGQCGDVYPANKLARFGNAKICPSCYRTATRGGGISFGGGGGGADSKKRMIKMLAVMVVLVLVAVWRFTHT